MSSKRKRPNKSKWDGKKRSRALVDLPMDIASAHDAFVAPSPYAHALRYIPTSQKVTLRYAQKFAINSALGLAGSQVFRANSLFDPDFSGSGHQPRGFDQLMTMYDHYQVVGGQCKIMTAQPDISAVVGISLRDTNAAVSAYIDYFETNPNNLVMGVCGYGGEPFHLTSSYSQKKFFGNGKLEEQFEGSVAANASEGAFYHVFQTAVNDVSPCVLYYTVVIDYIAIFTEPKQPPQS